MLSLIIVSMLSCSSPDVAMLKEEAPETLQQPQQIEFTDTAHYERANVMFQVCGHWSIDNKFNSFPNF